jgi:ABC-type lipoprotein release transport system permease subunit
MERTKTISALRFLTLGMTILLVALLFLSKGSGLVEFLLGVATGLSIGVQTMVWNKQLQWHREPERNDTVQLGLTESRR